MSKKTGYLFKNKYKTKPEHPDYCGVLVIGGSEYRVSGWLATTKEAGIPYLSLAVRLKTRQTIQAKIDETNTDPVKPV